MKKLLLFAFVSAVIFACTSPQTEEKKPEDTAPVAPPPVEFADQKYMEVGKKMLNAFQSGNMDAWMAVYADNAVYQWNNGDSLANKAAIDEHWRKRRLETVDTIIFSNAIFLPVKVNQPQSVEAPGVWLLTWYQIDVTYHTGKKVVQWIHTDYHFDAADKIDRAIQYVDMAPIKAALGK